MKHILFAALAALMAAPAAAAPNETAVLAGGCFWGMEAVFEHVKGVKDVVSGYAGGAPKDANYDAVGSERTRHAEAVRITYDPSQVSYAQLLQVYFAVAHDPTEVNRQGPDVGPSYRSAIFPRTAGSGAGRPSLHRADDRVGRLQEADRDEDRARPLLSGRGLSPGFRAEESVPPVHPGPRPAQSRRAQVEIPAAVESPKALKFHALFRLGRQRRGLTLYDGFATPAGARGHADDQSIR